MKYTISSVDDDELYSRSGLYFNTSILCFLFARVLARLRLSDTTGWRISQQSEHKLDQLEIY